MPDAKLILKWLPTNQRYAFTFGDALIRLYRDALVSFPILFVNRQDAIAAANQCGLCVLSDGVVFVASH